jgi:hypothetical protein
MFGIADVAPPPWFTAVAALTPGLGIAVNTTSFGWIDFRLRGTASV